MDQLNSFAVCLRKSLCAVVLSWVIFFALEASGYDFFRYKIEFKNPNGEVQYSFVPPTHTGFLVPGAGKSSISIPENTTDSVCGKGTFILYTKRDLVANKDDPGPYLFAATNYTCVKYYNASRIASIQAVYSTFGLQRVVDNNVQSKGYVYRKRNFGGWSINAEYADKRQPFEDAAATSIVILGQRPFFVEWWNYADRKVYKYCLIPPEGVFTVCTIPHFGEFINATRLNLNHFWTTDNTNLNTECPITTDHNGNRTTRYLLTLEKDCFEPNGIITKGPRQGGRLDPICWPLENGGLDNDKKGIIDDIIKSITDVANNPDRHLNATAKDRWIFEIFEICIDIMKAVCGEPILDSNFIEIFAQMYYIHYSQHINKTPYLISDVDLLEILWDLNVCMSQVDLNNYRTIYEKTKSTILSYKAESDMVEIFNNTIILKDELTQFNYVMEINWLMGNLAAIICSDAKKYVANFYLRFVTIYDKLYFQPLQQLWKNGTGNHRFYERAFGGYGMQKTLNKLALCTYNAYNITAATFIFPRVIEHEDYPAVNKK